MKAIQGGLCAARICLIYFIKVLNSCFAQIASFIKRWCCLGALLLPAWASAAPMLWFADDSTLYQADLSTNTLLRSLPVTVLALSADSTGGAWITTPSQVQRIDSGGVVRLSVNFATLGLASSGLVAADPRDGSAWIYSARRLLHLGLAGEVLSTTTLPTDNNAVALSVSLDQRVWVQSNSALLVVSSTGGLISQTTVTGSLAGPASSLAVDSLAPLAWVARENVNKNAKVAGRNLVRLDYSSAQPVITANDLSSVNAVAVDSASGDALVLSDAKLQRYSATGSPLPAVDLGAIGLTAARGIAIDPRIGSIWLAHERGVSAVAASGALLASIATTGAVSRISASPFRPVPSLTLLTPLAQAKTNNASPIFSLGYGADCYGSACTFSASRASAYTLNALLDGSAINQLFVFDTQNSRANYTVGTPLADGAHQFSAFITDRFGQVSNTVTSSLTIDTVPPRIVEFTPPSGSRVAQAGIAVTGRIDEAGIVQLGDLAMPGPNFSFTSQLVPGSNDLRLSATDAAGNSTQLSLTYYYLTLAVAAPANGASIQASNVQVGGSFTGPADMSVSVNGVAASITGNSYSANVPLAEGSNTLNITGSSGGVTVTKVVTVTRTGGVGGTLTPSAIDPTVASILADTTAFLYSGSNPVQTGVAQGTIEAKRAAVLRGKVLSRDNEPVSGVKVTVLNQLKFGQTLSRTDGMYDMAVNGGGVLTITFEKSGFLPVQRQANVPWQDFVVFDDVVMIPLDAKVTTIDLATNTLQVARANPVTDGDGVRQSTVVFPAGTVATMVMSDGSLRPLTTLNVRSTEYTVGPTGPKAMPGPLPPASGYTYATELSVDEAIAAGAKSVSFNQPVYHYVENFLNFPVGGVVPSGYYDRVKAAWVPSKNGKIIKILDIAGGLAALDTNGDGTADDASQLTALKISDAERQQLAALYPVNTILWRVPIDHFTPWDHNWPYGPPPDATAPKQPDPAVDENLDDYDCEEGSIIEAQNQTLGERIGIAGTPFTLNYRSARVLGRKHIVSINLTGGNIPSSLRRVDLEVAIAGQRIVKSFPAITNQNFRFEWDGRDAYGRQVIGGGVATVRIGYVYGAVYLQPGTFLAAFGGFGTTPISGERSSNELTIWQESKIDISGSSSQIIGSAGIGAWTVDVHHAYEPIGATLALGDGTKVSAQNIALSMKILAGGSALGWLMEGGVASKVKFSAKGMVAGPDGSIYFNSDNKIWRIKSDGLLQKVAGNGGAYYDGDSKLAVNAAISYFSGKMALGPDGSLYFGDRFNHRVRRISPEGIIYTIAGDGSPYSTGDGGLATVARVNSPTGVALGRDGSVFVVDNWSSIRRIGTDGIITTVIGVNGRYGYTPDGVLAKDATINSSVEGIAVGPDGNLYFADGGRIRRINSDGTLHTVAGAGGYVWNNPGDGGAAEKANLGTVYSIAFGPDGSLYLSDSSLKTIRRIGSDGAINKFAGNGSGYVPPNGGLPTATGIEGAGLYSLALAVAPDGAVLISGGDAPILRVARTMPSFGVDMIAIPSSDGAQVYQFDRAGRHLKTLNARTGAVIYQFSYSAGKLVRVSDGDGNVTAIERDGMGQATAIVAPDGQRTVLGYDSNGWLNRVTNPLKQSHQAEYTVDGLMTRFGQPTGAASSMQYDPMGRLVMDQNAAGGSWSLARTEVAGGYLATLTSAEGRTTTYRVDAMTTGGQRTTTIASDGASTSTSHDINGVWTTVLANGTKITSTLGADPRFGIQAPFNTSEIVKLPSGLTQTTSKTRVATLSNVDDLLSLKQEKSTVSVNGKVFSTVYDATNRQLTTTSALGRSVVVRTDVMGRPVFTQVGGLEPTSYAYDSRGRLIGVTQGSGTTSRSLAYAYGSDGYLAKVTDPLLQTVIYQRDAVGRVTQANLPGNRVLGVSYDANGNVTGLTPPDKPTHTMTYTPVDLESKYAPPAVDGIADPATTNAYNRDKEMTRIERPDGTRIDLAYDSGGRLSSITPSVGAGDAINFGYSSSTGQLTSVGTADAALAYVYDGPLLIQKTISGSVSGTLVRTYDNDFRVKQLSIGASTTAYAYDNDGLLTGVGALAITRDPSLGFITGTVLGGVVTTQGYDSFGALANFSAAFGASPLLSYGLGYDKAGRIVTKTETVTGVTVRYDYDYDLAGRLSRVSRDGSQIASYGYDNNGNRTTLDGQVVASYDAQDRLKNYGAATYVYTALGTLQSKTRNGDATRYRYDAFGNLKNVMLADGTVVDYVIDGTNRRIGKKVNGSLIQGFLYQDGLRIAAELDGSNAIVARFAYGNKPNVPEYMQKAGNTYRLITDHLGSVRLVVDSQTGQIVQRLDYDAWGAITSDSNPGFQPFGYAGGLYDPHTQLTRFGVRDYDAQTGRWTAKDPIRFAGGDSNIYGYVGGNPISRADPSGLFWWIPLYYGAVYATELSIAAIIAAEILGGIPNPVTSPVTGAAQIASKAQAIHEVLDPIAQARRTTAVLRTNTCDIAAGGVRDLTPAQRAVAQSVDASTAALPGAHAEVTAIKNAQQNGQLPQFLETTTNICPDCAAFIESTGGAVTGPRSAKW